MRDPIRILRVIARLNIGGPAIHASLLATRLDPCRFRTLTVYGALAIGEGDMTDLLEDAEQRRIHQLGRPVRPWRDAMALRHLLRLLREFQPDIVHTHTAKAGTLGRLAAAIHNARRPHRRVRVVHTYHGHVFSGYFGAWQTKAILALERGSPPALLEARRAR